MKDYEKMWKHLKNYVINTLAAYQCGDAMSIAEASFEEIFIRDIFQNMKNIEQMCDDENYSDNK